MELPPTLPISGPIVSLVDADGTFVNYAWYGQTKGTHVLTRSLSTPNFVSADGSTPGLDLFFRLNFFHLQDDPGGYSGQYTITFENLRLTGAPLPSITAQSYNPATQEFTLTSNPIPGKSYSILFAPDLSRAFTPLLTDIPSDGAATTTTVTVPGGNSGFLPCTTAGFQREADTKLRLAAACADLAHARCGGRRPQAVNGPLHAVVRGEDVQHDLGLALDHKNHYNPDVINAAGEREIASSVNAL